MMKKQNKNYILEHKFQKTKNIINEMKTNMFKQGMISQKQYDSMQYDTKAASIKGAFFKIVSTLLDKIPATRNSDLHKSVYNKMCKAYTIAEAKAAVKAVQPKKRGLFKPHTKSNVQGRGK